MDINLKDYLKKFTPEQVSEIKKTARRNTSERSELIKELYNEHYLYWNSKSNLEAFNKKYQPKERTGENQALFKKSKEYYPAMRVSRFCIKTAHIPTGDLYYLVSVAKDMKQRKQNFNKWLWYSMKPKEVENKEDSEVIPSNKTTQTGLKSSNMVK